MNIQRLDQQIARGQRAIAEIDALLERGAEFLATLPVDQKYGLKAPAAFLAAMEWEAERAQETQDEMGVLEVRLDQELNAIQHLRLVKQMRAVAFRTGDEIGRTERGGYAMLLPWTNAGEMKSITQMMTRVAHEIAPDAEIESGWLVTQNDAVFPNLAPASTQALTATRGR